MTVLHTVCLFCLFISIHSFSTWRDNKELRDEVRNGDRDFFDVTNNLDPNEIYDNIMEMPEMKKHFDLSSMINVLGSVHSPTEISFTSTDIPFQSPRGTHLGSNPSFITSPLPSSSIPSSLSTSIPPSTSPPFFSSSTLFSVSSSSLFILRSHSMDLVHHGLGITPLHTNRSFFGTIESVVKGERRPSPPSAPLMILTRPSSFHFLPNKSLHSRWSSTSSTTQSYSSIQLSSTIPSIHITHTPTISITTTIKHANEGKRKKKKHLWPVWKKDRIVWVRSPPTHPPNTISFTSTHRPISSHHPSLERRRGPTFNCRVLNPQLDGRPSHLNDSNCKMMFAGIPRDNSCRCVYKVEGRDWIGCATGYIYTCTRQ